MGLLSCFSNIEVTRGAKMELIHGICAVFFIIITTIFAFMVTCEVLSWCGYGLVSYWMTEQETSKESSPAPSMVSVQYLSSLLLCFIAVVMNFLLVESRSKNILLHLRQSRLCLNAYWKYIGYALKFRLRFTSNWYSYSTYFALDTEAMWINRF